MKRLVLIALLLVVPSAFGANAQRRALQSAFRKAVEKPAVRLAVEQEVRRQLARVRPIALVRGYWVTPIDMSAVLAVPAVQSALPATLNRNSGIVLVLTTNQLATQFQIPIANVTRMIGVEAVTQGVSDGAMMNPQGSGIPIFSVIAWVEDVWDWLAAALQNWEHDSEVKSNEKNCQDKGPEGDCDGDGKKNKDDPCPNDADQGCGGGSGSMVGCIIITCQRRVFTTEFGSQIDSMIQQTVSQVAQSNRMRQVVPLGQISVAFRY